MEHPTDVLIDPPRNEVGVTHSDSETIRVTEVTVPMDLDTGMPPESMALRTIADQISRASVAGQPMVVHAVLLRYERDPFALVNGTLIHGPQADQLT